MCVWENQRNVVCWGEKRGVFYQGSVSHCQLGTTLTLPKDKACLCCIQESSVYVMASHIPSAQHKLAPKVSNTKYIPKVGEMVLTGTALTHHLGTGVT